MTCNNFVCKSCPNGKAGTYPTREDLRTHLQLAHGVYVIQIYSTLSESWRFICSCGCELDPYVPTWDDAAGLALWHYNMTHKHIPKHAALPVKPYSREQVAA